jgi:hypothetical protein
MLSRIAKSTGILARLRAAWRQDAHDVTKPIANEVQRLRRDLDRARADLQEMSVRAARADRTAAQLRSMLLLNESQRERSAHLDRVLDPARIEAHVRAAVCAAQVQTEPYEHIVVERLLPEDVYELLIETIPPLPFFTEHDPIKQDLVLPLDLGPTLGSRAWNFLNDVVAPQMLRPSVMAKFSEPLRQHYRTIFGDAHVEQASELPQSTSGGRIMLRRPGYHLAPHRDPKRSLVTCLLYMARPGDSDTFGTQIFRVDHDSEAGYKQTYYPEQEGHACELVKVVPFRPNSMLAFLNSRGAHGASIPADAPAHVGRYAYQFYVAPETESLSALIKQLPRERRVMWQNKNKVTPAS